MADNNFQRPQRKKNALDNRKLNLTAKNEQGKMASLIWGLYSNNPRITVYTNIEGDKDNGRVSANMDTPTFYSFLVLLRMAIKFRPTENEPEKKWKVENMRPNFKPGGGRPDGYVTESELWVGKDREGCVWMCVTAYNRPRVKFVFGSSEYHNIFHGTGEQFSKAESSVLAAEGYADLLAPMLANLQVTEWIEPQPKGDRQGGGGGGYRGGNNSGGGGYRNNNGGGNSNSGGGGGDSFDGGDDIPF